MLKLNKVFIRLNNIFGTTGVRLKYGVERGQPVMTPVTMAASTVLKAASGHFVTIDGSGNAAITTAASTTIFGAVEGGYEYTTSSTAGADKLACDTSCTTIYRIPVSSGTYSRATHRGAYCDLAVSSNIQGAALGTQTRKHLIIVNGDETNNKWVDVRINQAIQGK